CIDFIVLYYATGLLGATAVPINIRYRRSELRYLVRHSRMSVLVTSDMIRDHVDLLGLVDASFDDFAGSARDEPLRLADAPDLRHVVLCGGRTPLPALRLDDVLAAGATAPRAFGSFTEAAGPDDVLMVLYTSGTTASPKGCEIPQHAVTENWTHWAEALHLREGERIWVPCPFFHIAGIGPMVGATIAGATAISASHFDADIAIAQIEREQPAHLFPAFPPLTFGILRHPRYDRERFAFLRTLHNVAPPETERVVQALLPAGAALLNNFGMTESAGCVTYTRPELPVDVRTDTTGPALPGMEVRIADVDTCAELPRGERGELQFRGPNTFRAYLYDPVATAATIIDGGWIRTGDLAEMDDDGNVAYIGRIKEMMKVGGENVAPIEVEAHLSTHPAVQLVQVVGRDDERYGEVPVAFVELVAGAHATAEELIAHCRGQLASFKVPREVRFVTEWPMSATKIQKRVLREQLHAEPS
ncbi:MAG: AMP-binding protein, partial [Ilumatobacteraceae bacterium]|nr:AMP-binding protein [Ilumatobacteraceae bacterium]